jgi:hypothetical protein
MLLHFLANPKMNSDISSLVKDCSDNHADNDDGAFDPTMLPCNPQNHIPWMLWPPPRTAVNGMALKIFIRSAVERKLMRCPRPTDAGHMKWNCTSMEPFPWHTILDQTLLRHSS